MEFLKEIKSTLFIMSGFYIAIGLFMLLSPVAVSNFICYIIGTICLILGGLSVYTYLQSEVYGPLGVATLIMAIIFIALGVFIFMNPEVFASFIPLIMGLVLVIESFTKMQSASTLKKYNYKNWWQILVAALLVFIFGILLIFNPFTTITILIRVIGAFLIVNGISNAMTAISYTKIEKSIK